MRYFVYCRKSSEAEDRQILSIESQLSTLQRTFQDRSEMQIVSVYQEAFSAKAPGRPQFDEMLSRIERGEADGIVAWAPDRLARNSIDGGRIIYLLDRGVILDLKFATYTFENNSQGKFMLQIMFGQSKYYSDALSENVKRGNRTKLDKGWRPNQAPLGYLNDATTKTITKDPVHFPLIRRMFDLMLTGAYSPKQLAVIARDEWGFRTPKRKRIGGNPLAMSSVYKILSNPFYAGLIIWNAQTYPGKHEPVVSIDEFNRIRSLLHRPARPRPQRHTFAFTGMIRCGECRLWITAEHKTNRYGHQYVYYHCSKRKLGPRCTQPCIEVASLEEQVYGFLSHLAIQRHVETWVLKELALDAERFKDEEEARRRSLENALAETRAQIGELTGLRLRNLITDAEFLAQRQTLHQEQLRLGRKLSECKPRHDPLEPATELFSFSNIAAEWFSRGDNQSKRLILETVGSNLTLSNKILNIEAKKPFTSFAEYGTRTRRLGVIDDVRTCPFGTKSFAVQWLSEIRANLNDPECATIVHNIKMLRQHFEPEIVAMEKNPPPLSAKAA